MESSAIVTATDLHKIYGHGETAVHALDGVTISFMRGQYNAIMGPSGSGKSTLMHCLAGLDRPTSGSVEIDGLELTALDDKRLTDLRREKIGFIFQAFNLLPVLTAEENVTLPLTIAGRDVDQAWVDKLLENVGLTTGARTGLPSSRAASSSASRSRARSSRGRPWCSRTSPPGTSTPKRARRS